MEENRKGGGMRFVAALVLGLIVAAANALVTVRDAVGEWTFLQPPSFASLRELLNAQFAANPSGFTFLVAAPVLLALVVAAVSGRRQLVTGPAAAPVEAEPKTPGEDALRLLRILQEDARFVDFIQEDIDAYDDAQIGAAARSIHAGCRKALNGRVTLQRIFDVEEGGKVTVGSDFDPSHVRLTGNVGGAPPFSGTLQHGGWRAAGVTLPESPGAFDATVIAPAEVEIA
jgi:hypothetical protein